MPPPPTLPSFPSSETLSLAQLHVACSSSVKSHIKCHHLRETIGYHPKEQDSYIFSPLLCLDPFLHVIIYFVLLILAHFLSLLAQVWLYESKHLACAQPTTLRPQLMAHIQWIIMATEDHWHDNRHCTAYVYMSGAWRKQMERKETFPRQDEIWEYLLIRRRWSHSPSHPASNPSGKTGVVMSQINKGVKAILCQEAADPLSSSFSSLS